MEGMDENKVERSMELDGQIRGCGGRGRWGMQSVGRSKRPDAASAPRIVGSWDQSKGRGARGASAEVTNQWWLPDFGLPLDCPSLLSVAHGMTCMAGLVFHVKRLRASQKMAAGTSVNPGRQTI